MRSALGSMFAQRKMTSANKSHFQTVLKRHATRQIPNAVAKHVAKSVAIRMPAA